MVSPSLRQLEIFAQMVASGSVGDCDQMLGLPVVQVERDKASLEMRLGYRLFERTGAQARLTPAGHKTAQAMALLSQGEAQAPTPAALSLDAPSPDTSRVDPASLRQAIRLAAPAPVFGHFQDALAAFEEANEDIAITLDLNIQLAPDAAAALAAGQIDIAYFYALTESDDLPSRYGWSEQLNLYAGEDHILARAEVISREALAAIPILAMDRHNGLRHVIEDALARDRVILGPPLLETDNMFEIISGLREGHGCFIAFGPMARDLGRMSGIRRLPLEVPLPAIEVRQAVSARSTQRAGVQALADFLFL